jgi:hypothetical protein
MKYFIKYFFMVSICFNICFIVYFIWYKIDYNENRKLNFWKKISYEEGYKFLENKMKKEFPEVDFKKKYCIVYFWNPSWYDFKHADPMKSLDSLASNLGKYSFNYLFATEMDELDAKSFLISRGASFKNFKVLGGMDDFISGVYNVKPPKRKLVFGSNTQEIECSDILKMKEPGYYLLLDTDGKIIYYNYKYFNPLRDTFLIRKLKTLKTSNIFLK